MKLNAHESIPAVGGKGGRGEAKFRRELRGPGEIWNDPLTCGGVVFHSLLVVQDLTTAQVGRGPGGTYKHTCLEERVYKC